MSLSIILKTFESPKKNLTKTFGSTTLDVSGVLKENTSIEDPVIIIKATSSIANYDYMVISEFSRSYFIIGKKSIANNLWEVTAHVDVLSTFATAIKSNTAVIRRQEGRYNLYLDDPEFKTLNYERLQTLKFPANSFLKNLSYVLTINGDSANT